MSGPSPVLFSNLNSAPLRPSTTPIAPKPRHRHHIHHPHYHRQKDHDRTPQSAVVSSTTLDEFLGHGQSAVGGTVGWRPTEGRSGSGSVEGDLQKEDEEVKEKELRWEDVEKVRERRGECEEQLLTSISNLSTLGTSTTRRLDYTYYSLLSSISSIRDTLSSLSNLAQETTALEKSFSQQAIPSLIDPITQQIDALSTSFEYETEEKIKGLEKRMRGAREKTEGLGRRLEGVKRTVEGWEAKRIEERRRNRRRLGILWAVLGSLVGLFLLVYLIRHQSDGGTGDEVVKMGQVGWGGNQTKMSMGKEDVGKPVGKFSQSNMETTASRAERTVHAAMRTDRGDDDVDSRLRIFDEL